jgi:hypothetical protein
MRTTTWAILGSLTINLVLGLMITAVFSVTPRATAAAKAPGSPECSAHVAAPARQAPAQPARPGHRYIVAVRMGWAL